MKTFVPLFSRILRSLALLSVVGLLATPIFAQNRLKDKTEATSLAADDWLYLDGATNGVRKFDPHKFMQWTRAAGLVPFFSSSATEATSAGFKFLPATQNLTVNSNDGLTTGSFVVRGSGSSAIFTNVGGGWSLEDPINTLFSDVVNSYIRASGNFRIGGYLQITDIADTADTGTIRLGNTALIAWESEPAGTDATLGVDSSNLLISSVGISAPTGVFGSTTSLLLGTSGSAVGNIGFRNATSGTATLAPPTGALGTYSVTLPNAASTLPIFGQQITFTGPTAARSIALPDAAFTVARSDGSNTFTGVQTMTSAALTTPVIAGGLTASGSGANTFVGSSGTFITSSGANTLSGATTINDAATPSLTTASGKTNTGFVQINGKTSGALKFLPADATAQTVTVATAAQTTGASTLTIPDMAGAAATFAFINKTQTFTGTQTFGTLVATTLNGNTLTAGSSTFTGTAGQTYTFPATTSTIFGSTTKTDVLQAADFAADAGANDTYTATLAPAITAYVTGARYRFKANTANTGAASINYNAIGAKTIVKLQGGITTALADNDIRAGQWVETVYDGTNMQMVSALGNSPSASVTGTDTYVTFFDGANNPAGDAGMTYNKTTDSLTLAGSITTGSGASTAGALVLTQGTTQSTGTTNITLQAPAAVTSHIYTLPATVGTNGAFWTQTTSSTTATLLNTKVVPTGAVVGDSDTQTLTNKRNTARITSISSSATPTVNTDNYDCVTITALAAAITSMTTNLTGTPSNFDQIEFRILDNGTARAITWGASFASGIATLPTTTTVNKALHAYFEWDSVQSKWMCQATGSYP